MTASHPSCSLTLTSPTVITGEEIKNMGARDIVDVLRTVPGFDLVHELGVTSHQAAVRGMSTPLNLSVKIMMNGHSMASVFNSPHTHFDAMPVANIKQIEIIRGPGSHFRPHGCCQLNEKSDNKGGIR